MFGHFSALRPLALALTTLILISGCGEDDADAIEEGQEFVARDQALQECIRAWAPDYGARFLAGETYFTPRLATDEGCDTLRWSLVASPAASEARLQGEGEEGRLTPLVLGEYRLALIDGDRVTSIEEVIEVIDPLSRPFHNYNYFPSHRVATQVGQQLWVAGVYSPEVARLDVSSGEALPPILVGQWPTALAYAEGAGVVLVANKASDTLGIIDVATLSQVDAIWVGDEPSDIVWDEARGRAYISLAGAGQLAVVDVAARERIATLDVVFDPLALAMSPDGQTLVVASHRSGQSDFFPHDVREVESERDVAIVDLEALEVSGHILEVAATIQAMEFVEGALWITATSGNTEGGLNDPEAKSFEHELFTLALAPGLAERDQSVDLSRQASSGGSTATIHGFTRCADALWVVAEGANQAVELDAASLEERRRVALTGRPRAVVCVSGEPWVISSNTMSVTHISAAAEASYPLGLTERRDELLIEGLERFTGQGLGAGDNRSCNNCHADGLSDGQVWNAGPVESRLMSRPLRWLEGTSMIGWDGYVGSVKISGYVGGPTINDRGTTESSLAMGAYLASLMPSPPANSLTQRDGSLSEEGLEGKALFEGKAACTGCHSGPVFTNQQVMAEGLTEGKTDVPTLVDVARIGSWYKTGVMPTLHDTVVDTADKFGVSLNDAELKALTRYLEELTGRDFFVLHADLGPSEEAFPVDGSITLTFSYPVDDADTNLAHIAIVDADDVAVPLSMVVKGRHVTLTPEDDLAASAAYQVRVSSEFSADDARRIVAPSTFAFETAASGSLSFEGNYVLTVWVPMLDFVSGGFDFDDLVEQSSRISATASAQGADVTIDYGADMLYDDLFVLDGDMLMTRDLPIAVGPSFLNGAPIVAEAQDTNDDGIVDLVEGVMNMTGPGIELPDIAYTIEELPPGTCIPGSEGEAPPVITQEGDTVSVDWGEGGALALYVTSPDAQLPFGPGNIEGGTTYWALTATNFPETFSGPVTYGSVPEGAEDASEVNGGPLGGAPLESGVCYRFSVVVDLKFSHTMLIWP